MAGLFQKPHTADGGADSDKNQIKPPQKFLRWIIEEPVAVLIITALIFNVINRSVTESQRILLHPMVLNSFTAVSNHHPRFERLVAKPMKKLRAKQQQQQHLEVSPHGVHDAPLVPGDMDGDGVVDWQAEMAVVLSELLIGLVLVYLVYRFMRYAQKRYVENDKKKLAQKSAATAAVPEVTINTTINNNNPNK